ncbi:unnamed protein product [Cladocopium goreaui]|uniref:Nocturnin (Carbon catabolite repression 4-lik e protein) n=1 Tax=Cladocopium goreaui TaxID=2562237 RepID=A0A9P1M3P5_9DINO|nr:unnamed protein product [Cladocopium goreaui]
MARSLARQWLSSCAVSGKRRLRVMHWNILADCLAKSAPRLSLQRGFRCDPEHLRWETRRAKILEEIQKHQPDILGLCEVDRFDDLEVNLADDGYEGTYKRKRSPAKDGVATFWKTTPLEEGLRRAIFLEYGNQRTKAAQVAILQRLWPRDRSSGKGLVVCAVHLRASADEAFRMQQASELVTALTDFARGDEQIILADVNSNFDQSSSDLAASNVYSYFTSCGYRCAYQTMAAKAAAQRYSHYTTWAGWASGDFMSCCDHIFISQGVDVEAVLDVPDPDALAEEFPEKLPCAAYPSDHLSLVADVLVP